MAEFSRDEGSVIAMDGEPPRLSRRRLVQLGLGAGVLGAGSMLALGGVWAHDMNADRLSVLGSGSGLSLFLTAGQARCLIAAGNRADDFTNALGRCRFPTTRRIDLLLLTPSALGGIADQAINIANGRYTARIGSVKLTAATAHFGSIPILPSPRRIRLPNGITLEIESTASPDAQKSQPVWRIVIHRGASRIVAVSSTAAATRFRPIGPVSVAICPDDAVSETLKTLRPRALIAGTGREQPPLDLAASGTARQSPPIFAVTSGQTLEMTWRQGGLRLSGVAPLPAATGTPAATDDAPRPSPQTPA